jgi:ribosomal silencing factor RsfS
LTSLEQARRIAGLAQEKLAQDVVILDMRPVVSYTDYFVVCTGPEHAAGARSTTRCTSG